MSNTRQFMPNNNTFYIHHFHQFFIGFIVALFIAIILVGLLLYQISNRPEPTYVALSANGKEQRLLTPEIDPNLLPPTLINWASKAAVAAYTFDFVNYEEELSSAQHYFTEAGWQVYRNSIASAIQTVRQNQLFVNGVVVGPPVIAHQGDLPGKGYVWRIQLPFLVTYQSAELTTRKYYTVIISVIRVPTWINPTGIGIDQFVMES